MKFELFKGTNGQWYWRYVAGNGQIVAMGGEGYVNRSDAIHGMDLVRNHALAAARYELLNSGRWQAI